MECHIYKNTKCICFMCIKIQNYFHIESLPKGQGPIVLIHNISGIGRQNNEYYCIIYNYI